MLRVVRRTFRHWPPPLLATLAVYFGYRLLAEPNWFTWACVAIGATGFLMNLVVITANDGSMPFAGDQEDMSRDEDLYKPIDARTRLRLLSDWIGAGGWMVSPGDLLLGAAVVASVIRWAADWR